MCNIIYRASSMWIALFIDGILLSYFTGNGYEALKIFFPTLHVRKESNAFSNTVSFA